MSSPAEVVMGLLGNNSIGVLGASSGWRLGAGILLDAPDTQIVVNDSPGQAPDPKWLLDYPFVQIRVRGAKDGYAAAYQKAKDAHDVLLGIAPQTGSYGRVDGIIATGSPSFIGIDSLNRPIFSTNYKMFFEPASSSLTNRTQL
jgi:hypothetical protein